MNYYLYHHSEALSLTSYILQSFRESMGFDAVNRVRAGCEENYTCNGVNYNKYKPHAQ